jgi:hypothetical protein
MVYLLQELSAFMAATIPGAPSEIASLNTKEEMEQEEAKAKVAATELKSGLDNVAMHAVDCINKQDNAIQQLTQELEELRKEHQQSTASVTNHLSNTVTGPINTTTLPQSIDTNPGVSNSTSVPAHGEISYTMNAMLENMIL